MFNLGMRNKLEIGQDQRIKYVADGQAWGYYIGYLKIIFNKWDSTINKARGTDFQDTESGKDLRELIVDRRLFIVIPRDGFCCRNLSELDPKIKFITRMPELKHLRGGVQERKYNNSLYKIIRNGENPTYAMIEFATPLLNMYEMSQHSEKYSGFRFTIEDREEQVNEFYNTLKRILEEDKNCEGKYELVLMGSAEMYENNKHKLGDIICEKIHGPKGIPISS